MIGSLRGTILEVHPAYILIEVGGIGYVVKTSIPTLTALKTGQEVFVYIHDHLREDAHDLFGFLSHEELRFFEKLLSVSGVGPKVALTILSAGSIETVRRAVMMGDLSTLTSVPGVGTKTAQKIVLELKGQLVEEPGVSSEDREVLDALVALGYPAAEARKTLKELNPDITGTSERIREALRYLAP